MIIGDWCDPPAWLVRVPFGVMGYSKETRPLFPARDEASGQPRTWYYQIRYSGELRERIVTGSFRKW